MKCAMYVRVSTDKQEAGNQLLQLRDYAGKSGWDVFREYVDVVSGKETTRKGFDEMFRDARRKLFDVVLFWDMSRFSRAGLKHTLDKLSELDNLGIKWHSYTEPYVSTADEFTKNVIIAVMASLAKIEREKISSRTKAGLERAKLQGAKLGRRPKKINVERIWREYVGQGGSINRASKVLPYSYGKVWEVIKKGPPEILPEKLREKAIKLRGVL